MTAAAVALRRQQVSGRQADGCRRDGAPGRVFRRRRQKNRQHWMLVARASGATPADEVSRVQTTLAANVIVTGLCETQLQLQPGLEVLCGALLVRNAVHSLLGSLLMCSVDG